MKLNERINCRGSRIMAETDVDKIVYEESKSYFDITKTLSSFNFYCFFLHEGLLAESKTYYLF